MNNEFRRLYRIENIVEIAGHLIVVLDDMYHRS